MNVVLSGGGDFRILYKALCQPVPLRHSDAAGFQSSVFTVNRRLITACFSASLGKAGTRGHKISDYFEVSVNR